MKITWFGTASILLETGAERLLFDPFWQLRGGSNPATIQDFVGEDTILITHGHFDHLASLPQLLELADATVFCTGTPARTLESFLEDGSSIVEIRPGMRLSFGDATVRTFQGRHIVFDRRLILETIRPARFLRHARNLPYLLWANRTFPEKGETLVYEVEAEGKRVMLLGSLGLDDQETYPTAPDVLVLPYQGSSDLPAAAAPVIERIQPRRILLSHFDDAFPPLSSDVDLRGLKQLMRRTFPGIPLVVPKAGKPVHIP